MARMKTNNTNILYYTSFVKFAIIRVIWKFGGFR